MLCSYGLLQSRDLLSLISVLIMNYLVDFHRLTIYARPFRKTSDVARACPGGGNAGGRRPLFEMLTYNFC